MGLLRPIGRWNTGDRVTLTLHGTVAHDRSGFVTVTWDERQPTIEWGADLEPEEDKHA
jgi:hypothetical protein